MSLPRQDVRFKLDADFHSALLALCDLDNVTIADFVERALVPVIRQRVHEIKLTHGRIVHLRISGISAVEIPQEDSKP